VEYKITFEPKFQVLEHTEDISKPSICVSKVYIFQVKYLAEEVTYARCLKLKRGEVHVSLFPEAASTVGKFEE